MPQSDAVAVDNQKLTSVGMESLGNNPAGRKRLDKPCDPALQIASGVAGISEHYNSTFIGCGKICCVGHEQEGLACTGTSQN